MTRIASVLLILGLSASIVAADYVNPPGWENDPFFTHQSWDFLTPSNPSAPDGEVPPVTPDWPTANIAACGSWSNQYGVGNGGWLFDQQIQLTPEGPLVSLYIPNTENPDRTKEIWIQVSLQANFTLDEQANIAFRGVDANWQFYAPHQVAIEHFDPANHRARVTARIDITPQPQYELIYISLGIPCDGYIFIDEIDVDTRCVPEPSTLAMLIAGCLLGCAGLAVRKSK